MSKNLRISLYILVPIIIWMISGQFIAEDVEDEKKLKVISSVVISKSEAAFIAPTIVLNASAISEKRVRVMAKTSGEVMPNNVTQGQWVIKDQVLCRLGVVELNRTEVKAPFSGFIEKIVKPGNLLNRGETCAVIIELDPITFIAEVPEAEIQKVIKGQKVLIELVTGQSIESTLSFVSKSATPSTRSFRVEAKIQNSNGLIRDGITGTMHITTNKILAHKISPSILVLSDDGIIGIRAVDDKDTVQFIPVNIIEDTLEGIWVTGIPNLTQIIVLGQGFVESGQDVQITELTTI
jgi:multidrug efflux pump subunit AcrA (membrane-fusion protein)